MSSQMKVFLEMIVIQFSNLEDVIIVKCTKQMSDLVIHVNNEQNLQGKDLKFNAFIFGLLKYALFRATSKGFLILMPFILICFSIRSLDSWFSLLGTCQNIIQKHYLPEAFLYLVKTTMKTLFDQLLLSLQMLSLLPFDLDLASEISLQNQSPVDCNVGIQHLEWEKTCPFLLSPDACVTTLSASIPVDCQMLSHHLSGIFRESPATFCSGTSGFTRDVITEKSKDDTDGGVSSSRLRRGCSQDSAIATGSSDYSNGSCPVINTSGDGDTDTHKPKTRRPFSCIECVGGWNVLNDEHLVINTSHPENVSQRITEDPRLCPKHALENDAASQETESLFFRPDPGGLGQCQQQKEENDIVDQINVDGDVEEEAEDNCEDEARDTEKGSLDATIAEPRHSDISSHNNGKETMNETAVNFPYDGDEDGAKFKELRMKWEILSCAGSEKKRAVNPNTRSKIPRLVTPPLKLSGRMEDSGGSAKTSASATTTSESNSSRSIISVVGDCLKSEENPRTPVEGRKSRLSLESPPCSLNGSGTKPNANLKLPTGQPFIVVKSSLDKSPVRKRLPVCKKVPSIPNSMQVKCKQVVSRGVGGPEQDEN